MNRAQAVVWIGECLNGNRLTLVDVGARGGLHPRWRDFQSVLDAIGFEPDKEECNRINQGMGSHDGVPLRCFPYALGEQDGLPRQFFVCVSPGCSSLYEPNLEFSLRFPYGPNLRVTGNIRVTLNRLDTVCKKEGLRPDYIKIDTQGSELDILEGGVNILGLVKFLELEVEFNPIYKDQPLFGDIDSFLRTHGFFLLGLRRTLWRRVPGSHGIKAATGGQMIHGDVLYYNERLFFGSDNATESDALKFLVILSAYEQSDLLAHMLGTPHPALVNIPAQERAMLVQGLTHPGLPLPALVRKILGRIRHARLRKLVDSLQNPHTDSWHDLDFF